MKPDVNSLLENAPKFEPFNLKESKEGPKPLTKGYMFGKGTFMVNHSGEMIFLKENIEEFLKLQDEAIEKGLLKRR